MNWTDDELHRYFTLQGVSVIPTGNGWVSCKMPEQQYGLCRSPTYGAAFINMLVHAAAAMFVAWRISRSTLFQERSTVLGRVDQPFSIACR